jgi:hypothetical protein
MDYTTSAPFDGDTAKAFDLAVSSLTSLGFEIKVKTDTTLVMTGPGMHNTRQSALFGATRIEVRHDAHQLVVNADLSGAEWLAKFAMYFPIGLSLGLSIVFLVVFSLAFENWLWVIPVAAACGGNLLLWLFLGPWMARRIRGRTASAVEVFAKNLAAA